MENTKTKIFQNEWLTPEQVSEIIGLGRTNTYKLFRLKGFPCVQIGRRYIVKASDLDKFLSEYKHSTIYLS